VAATVSLRVYSGSNAATESSAVTGADLISADNATNSLANRQANPVTVGTRSYEKWLKLKVDAAPANGITNVQMWGDGNIMTSTALWFTGGFVTGATPTNAASSVANADFVGFTAGNKAVWDSASLTATNATSKYAVFQLEVDATAGPGNWTQETVNYSYDET
jgi:uncharacterized Rossmann fold enzyme